MHFKIIQEGKEIICNIIMTFKNGNINYIVYNDGTKDETGELEIYASRYIIDNNKYVLMPIENDSEWDLIDEMINLNSKGE